MLIVDSREPAHVKDSYPDARSEALEYGDFSYTLPDNRLILIERKEPADLMASIIDGRLMRQVAGMVEECSKTGGQAYLLVCGMPVDRLGRLPLELIDSRLMDCQLAGCVVLVSLDYKKSIENIIRRSATVTDVVSVKKKIKKDTWQLSLLKCLPRVGHKMAKSLLAEHGSLDNALSALLDSKDKEFWRK